MNERTEGFLVGGLAHFLFFHILGISSSQLTFICFKMVKTTDHIIINHHEPYNNHILTIINHH